MPRVAVACKAAVLLAVVAPRAETAPWVAAPRVAVAVIRRPGAEPPVVVPRVHRAVVLKAAAALKAAVVVAAVR